jgi:hypothetical protein
MMIEWLPIAGAPKDESFVDLWVVEGEKSYRATECFFRKGKWLKFNWPNEQYFIIIGATHYLLLEPPVLEEPKNNGCQGCAMLSSLAKQMRKIGYDVAEANLREEIAGFKRALEAEKEAHFATNRALTAIIMEHELRQEGSIK